MYCKMEMGSIKGQTKRIKWAYEFVLDSLRLASLVAHFLLNDFRDQLNMRKTLDLNYSLKFINSPLLAISTYQPFHFLMVFRPSPQR